MIIPVRMPVMPVLMPVVMPVLMPVLIICLCLCLYLCLCAYACAHVRVYACLFLCLCLCLCLCLQLCLCLHSTCVPALIESRTSTRQLCSLNLFLLAIFIRVHFSNFQTKTMQRKSHNIEIVALDGFDEGTPYSLYAIAI